MPAKTRRRGVEAAWDGNLGAGFAGYASLHVPVGDVHRCHDHGRAAAVVPAGARLPGVPAAQRLRRARVDASGSVAGFSAALEVQYVGKIYVNDRNTDAAPAYTIGNVRVGFEQQRGSTGRCASSSRLNNITNVNYVGSVIVGDTNGRYFEPAPTRNFLVGVSVNATF